MEDDVTGFRKQFERFLQDTQSARLKSERDRDYADLKQWTEEEEKVLRSRGQAPVTFDYIREQVDFFVGMERNNRRDPKAYPRTREHSEAADACTDSLRYVADNNNFQDICSDGFEDLLVEGYCVGIVEPEIKNDQPEIKIRLVDWDRFYFDTHSRHRYFEDAAFMGVVVWMHKEEAKQLYPGKVDDIDGTFIGDNSDTFEDRPQWSDKKGSRVRICQHYYIKDGKWHICHFTGDTVLIESQPVPLVDEFGESYCPIIAAHAYIDRNNNRYGYVRRLRDPQDEVNHRRSKGLHLLSSRQVMYEEGAVVDEAETRNELKKPDGMIELATGALRDGTFQISQTGDMAAGQAAMYQDAVNKLDRSGANVAMQGEVSGMSGAAIDKLQQGGAIQIGCLFDTLKGWKVRLYRIVWMQVRQFWDKERWVRVTDNEDNLKWVGLNEQVTAQGALQAMAEEGSQEAMAILAELSQAGDPRLSEVVEVKNQVAEMDMDIVLDEGRDTINSQQEQFAGLVQLAQAYPDKVPFEALLELSTLPDKRRVRDLLVGDQSGQEQSAQMAQMQAQVNELIQQLQIQGMQLKLTEQQADVENTQADTLKKNIEAEQKRLENILMGSGVDPNIQVNI